MKSEKAVVALSALAQESRLAVFRLLLEEGGGVSAGDIAEKLGVPATTMSFHLSQLKNSGLITSEKKGRQIIYSANKKKVKKLAGFISGKDIAEPSVDAKYQL